MKLLYVICILLFTFSCANNKTVYWCGDHPCINKKEKEEYFKKNMSIEVKNLNDKNKEEPSYIEKMTEKAKLEQKRNIKKEKELAKKMKKDEKRRIKEEKELAKNLKTKHNKKDKVSTKKTEKKAEISTLVKNLEVNISNFNDLVDKINKKNTLRPYPDINDIPN